MVQPNLDPTYALAKDISDAQNRVYRLEQADVSLSGLHDVNVSAPVDGQALVWDVTTQKWVNENVPATGLAGVVPATKGGTGQSTYVVGDLLVGGATNTLNKVPAVAAGNALISQGVGVAPVWGDVPLAAGGTNASLTAVSGGAVYSNGSALGISAAGTTGQFLQSAGANAPVWASAPSTNVVINGGFDFWQRGTSLSSTSTNATTFLADRWRVIGGVSGGGSDNKVFQRNAAGLTGFQYSAQAQRPSTKSGVQITGFVTDIESANSIPFAGQTVTLSFYARAGANFSAASSALTSTIYTGTGLDGNLTTGYTGAVVTAQANTLTATWARYSQTLFIPSTANQIGLGLTYVPVGTAGAADYFEVTGVQLEQGSVATPFKRNAPSLQAELAACQRYYWRSSPNGNIYETHGQGLARSTTVGVIGIRVPVTMRVVPTVIESSALLLWNGVSTLGGSAVVFSADLKSNNYVTVDVTGGSLTASMPLFLMNGNNANGYIGFGAEL